MTQTPAKRPQLSPARPLAALAAEVQAIERPHPNLLLLYVLQSLAGLVAAPLILLPLYFRYHTLRYRFDDDGVHASWGILFRREISLTYARIQDIHLSRGIFERWLGLGTVQIQTASGSALAELSIEGTQQFVTVRDYHAHLFEDLELNRVEIRCATGNRRSCAIPRRLGFRKEGIIVQGQWVSGRPVDLAVYGILRSEWKKG